MDYVSENHSKHLLMVHLIFVVKYRRNVLIKFGNEISTYRLWRQNNNMKELAKFF